MIQSAVMFCAENVLHDSETNNMSVINIIDQINAVGFPVSIPRFTILNIFEKDTEEKIRFIQNLSAKIGDFELFNQDNPIVFSGIKHRTITPLIGLAIPTQGVLELTCKIDGNTVCTYKILVNLVQQPKGK